MAEVPSIPARSQVAAEAVADAAAALRSGQPVLILLTGPALRERGLELAGKIARKTGSRLSAQTFNARMERGAGRVAVDRLPYPVDIAVESLRTFKHIILAGSKPPVAFFAYPRKPSLLAQPDTQFHVLARPEEDVVHALEWLADEVGAGATEAEVSELALPGPATGAITASAIGQSVCALMPENTIVVDEGVTASRSYFGAFRNARPHTWLQNMGGSIGIGPPLAVGAAIACPDRRVVALQADGSFMYTVQALWTQARENLDIITVVFANRTYAILRHELANVGAANVGRKALDMLDLGRPDIDWVSLARGMGVAGVRAETMEQVNRGLEQGLGTRGPFLIEAVM